MYKEVWKPQNEHVASSRMPLTDKEDMIRIPFIKVRHSSMLTSWGTHFDNLTFVWGNPERHIFDFFSKCTPLKRKSQIGPVFNVDAKRRKITYNVFQRPLNQLYNRDLSSEIQEPWMVSIHLSLNPSFFLIVVISP